MSVLSPSPAASTRLADAFELLVIERLMRSPPGTEDVVVPDPPAWHAQAACRGVDDQTWRAFFPDKGRPADLALLVCARCPVTDDCLAYALTEELDDGIWGGRTPNERRAIRRRPRSSAA